jgi:nucleoside-diphosphate-sugar epimerase
LDFTYIDDLISGIALAIEHPESRNEIFNMTYGEARTIAEVAAIVQQQFPDLEIEHIERDRLMPARGTLSVAKARELLGYAPENPIEIGLAKYLAWYRTLVPSPALG